MALFAVTADTDRSPEQAWARLTDWPAHARFVPFTTVIADGPNGIGTVFTARTALGRLGFEDPMGIIAWEPPRFCRVEKRGTVMTGWAELTVEPRGSGARAIWREDVTVARLPAFAAPATRLSSRLLFGRVLRGLLAA